MTSSGANRAFLCHASEDKPVVERLARDLMASGIDTFFDAWEIVAGDSIRQRIDAGIEGCTHFIVVLSPTSVTKPWVNAELDAGFVARLGQRVRLIPVRLGLQADQLPPLLSGLRSPSLDDFNAGAREVISAILGVTERPPLGSVPAFASQAIRDSGLSPLAGRIAAYFVQATEKARHSDPRLSVEDLRALAGVDDDDIAEAVDELESYGLVAAPRAIIPPPLSFVWLAPTPQLFTTFDSALMPWNPEDDAAVIAAALVNEPSGSFVTVHLADRLGWTPRRINPALTYLLDRDLASGSQAQDANYVSYFIRKTVQTRRFLREAQPAPRAHSA